MRTRLPFLTVLAFLVGCLDAVGVGGGCSREMREVRRSEGTPEVNGPNEIAGGNFQEIWSYPDRVYTFRWGPSYETCQVTGPIPLNIVPPYLT